MPFLSCLTRNRNKTATACFSGMLAYTCVTALKAAADPSHFKKKKKKNRFHFSLAFLERKYLLKKVTVEEEKVLSK